MQKHKAKKRFGQNFLHDESIIDRIIHVIDPKPDDLLVEIGPGMGAITKPLLSKVHRLWAIELDKDLIPALNKLSSKPKNLIIFEDDALKFELEQLTTNPQSLRIVGNLPYNISTPLLFHLFKQKHLIKDMHFMLQREVANRIAASPSTKQYGRLTVMSQYHCDVELLIDVPSFAFDPIPKVDSVFLRLIPKPNPSKLISLESLEKVVKLAFSTRRKTISNALKSLLEKKDLISLGIDPNLRPEQLTVEDYVRLSQFQWHGEPKRDFL